MGENNAPPDPSSAARPAPGRAPGGSLPPSSSTTTTTTAPGAPPPRFTFTHDASLSRFAVPKAEYLSARDLPWDGIATGALVFSSSSSSSGAPSSDDLLSTPASSSTGSASSGVYCSPSLSRPQPQQQQKRVLLVQRAAHDSWPLRWEPPGGAVDAADASILHGCARELWEETGLRAVHFARLVGKPGGEALLNSKRTRTFGKFLFVVHVAPTPPPPLPLRDGEDQQQQQQQQQGHHGDVEELLQLLQLPRVTLDPNEHADHVWATRDEVRRGQVGELEVGEEGQQQQRQQRPRRIEVVSENTRNLVLQSFEGQSCREEQAA
ncbi:NUDIX hydrolase domain-like protein [Moelleriella libera RCEF 2490]|uniref:NUDIX hydrolase domain-like protein n=1 Tax=Moelleriella libera RCEF 2490 TaxID=1081109 RepID=A0A168F506_9HYPO|nr:NUDIX hydrolase domain-like protein [Moelleriella libera RCEF 2490]